MNKSYRQGQILRLIEQQRVQTQDDLARLLAGIGIQTTQVTLSRDIRELGLVKTSEGYRAIQPSSAGPDFSTVAADFLRDVRAAMHTVVLRTSPGNANAVAVALDRENWDEVVGTIAGDDTVLVVAPDSETAATLRERLLAYVRA